MCSKSFIQLLIYQIWALSEIPKRFKILYVDLIIGTDMSSLFLISESMWSNTCKCCQWRIAKFTWHHMPTKRIFFCMCILKQKSEAILLNNMFVSPSCFFFFSSLDNFGTLIDLCHNTHGCFPWGLLHIVFPDLLPLKGDKLSPITLTDRWWQ